MERYGDETYNNLEKAKQTKLKRYGATNYNNVEKTKQTNLEKYGVEYSWQRDDVKEKAKQTKLDRYGVETYTNRDKCVQTNLEKYGVEYSWQRDDVKEKAKQTKLDRYGNTVFNNKEKTHDTVKRKYHVDNVFQLQCVKDKIKAANLEKYGVEYNWQRDDIKEKIKQTNLARYGVENVMQNHDIRCSAQHKYTYDKQNFDSKAEIAYYIWLCEHNVKFTYQPTAKFAYVVDGVVHTYNPDFEVNGEYVEIKGLQFFENHDSNCRMINPYDRSQDDLYEAKHQCMLQNNVKIITDYSEYENYVNEKYTKDFLNLFKNNLEFPYPDDNVINTYHHSIYFANKFNYKSPVDAWNDKELVKRCALNRLKYSASCKPHDIIRGFSVARIAPKVSVFTKTLAIKLINTYMTQYNEIFDPFSGFSGRMLGACACGKRYIGQDINEIHVKESNEIIKKFNLNATVTKQDIFESTGEYDCLFTCSPYNLKETWNTNETNKSCDEWINECLARFKCKRYVFVVDKTEKYKDRIVEEISNKSHFCTSTEYVLVIDV